MPADEPEPQSNAPAAEPSADSVRKLTDARTLRALAHPVRMALLETLALEGPMTATEVGERIGESPTTCSFHLRQLARYEFVEEAGGGKGRARPWKITTIALSLSSSDDDPEVAMASTALVRMFRERQLDRYRVWLETQGGYPKEWRQAAGESQHVFYLTAEELRELNDELLAMLLPRFRDRLTDPSRRPAGSVPVEMQILAYPVRLPDPEG